MPHRTTTHTPPATTRGETYVERPVEREQPLTPLARWAQANPAPREHYGLQHTGDLDLTFSGWLVGESTQTVNGYYTGVFVYVTQGGQLVLAVERQAPGGARRYAASVQPDANAALRWLAESNRGRLGDLAKAAWLSACHYVPPLATHAVRRIA